MSAFKRIYTSRSVQYAYGQECPYGGSPEHPMFADTVNIYYHPILANSSPLKKEIPQLTVSVQEGPAAPTRSVKQQEYSRIQYKSSIILPFLNPSHISHFYQPGQAKRHVASKVYVYNIEEGGAASKSPH